MPNPTFMMLQNRQMQIDNTACIIQFLKSTATALKNTPHKHIYHLYFTDYMYTNWSYKMKKVVDGILYFKIYGGRPGRCSSVD